VKQVLPLLAQAQDACVAMEQRLVTRLRAVEAALRAYVERLVFIAAVNIEAATDVEADKPVLAAQRRTVAAVATLLARRLTVLCVEGGDTSGMGVSLNQFARDQLQAEMSAMALPPPSRSDQPPGTVLTPRAAAAAAAAGAAAANGGDSHGAAAPGVSDDDITTDGLPNKRQRRDSSPPRREGGDDGMEDANGGAFDPPPAVPATAMDAAPLGVGFMAHLPHAGGAGLQHHGAAAATMHSQRSVLGSISPSGGQAVALGEAPVGSLPPAGVAVTPVAGLLAADTSPGDGSGAGAAAHGAVADTVTPTGQKGPPDTVGQTQVLRTVAPAVLGCAIASASPSMPQGGQRLMFVSSADPEPEAAQEPAAEAQLVESEHVMVDEEGEEEEEEEEGEDDIDIQEALEIVHDDLVVPVPAVRDDDNDGDVSVPHADGEALPSFGDAADQLWADEAQAQLAAACPEPASGAEFRSPVGEDEDEAGAAVPMDDDVAADVSDSEADKEDTPPELMGPSGTQMVGGTQLMVWPDEGGAAPCALQPSRTQSQEVR
jgi:hypothetical protein